MRKLGLNTIITFTIALLLTLQILIPIPTASAVTSKLSGTIIDESTSDIITNSDLTVFHRRHNRYWSNRWDKHSSATTDNQGRYTLELEIGGSYLILVTHRNTDRDYDYIPYGFYYNPTEDFELKNIELWSASVVQFEGLDYFVETTAIPETTFKVKEQNTTEVINYGNLNLVYEFRGQYNYCINR